jgi:hypothetical protein
MVHVRVSYIAKHILRYILRNKPVKAQMQSHPAAPTNWRLAATRRPGGMRAATQAGFEKGFMAACNNMPLQ